MSKLGRVFANEAKFPERWKKGSFDDDTTYTIMHIPSGVELWVGNGSFFFAVHRPIGASFGLIERHALWWKFRHVRRALKKKDEVDVEAAVLSLLSDEKNAPSAPPSNP